MFYIITPFLIFRIRVIRRYLSKRCGVVSEGEVRVSGGRYYNVYIYIYERNGSQNFSTPTRRMVYGLR